MKHLYEAVLKLKFWSDTRGQDLIEYALMAGFIAIAAGAIVPGIAADITTIFTKVSTALVAAGG